MYPQQDCQTEAPPLRGQVPGYPASQNSGMRVPYYTYGDGDHSVPQPGPTIRPQEDSWAPPGAYGMGTWYPWPSPKWTLGSLIMNKGSGDELIPAELFQILNDDAVKVLHSTCQQIRKTQQWPQDWKRSVFIPIPMKDNDKVCSNYCTHLTCWQINAQNSPSQASTVHKLWTSRCSSWI